MSLQLFLITTGWGRYVGEGSPAWETFFYKNVFHVLWLVTAVPALVCIILFNLKRKNVRAALQAQEEEAAAEEAPVETNKEDVAKAVELAEGEAEVVPPQAEAEKVGNAV